MSRRAAIVSRTAPISKGCCLFIVLSPAELPTNVSDLSIFCGTNNDPHELLTVNANLGWSRTRQTGPPTACDGPCYC